MSIFGDFKAFFEKNYDLRYNVMKQTEEFRRKAPPGNSVALIEEEEALAENPDGLVDGGGGNDNEDGDDY